MKKDIQERIDEINSKHYNNEEITKDDIEYLLNIADPVYCNQCGSCGNDGCCPIHMCSYVNQYQHDYDVLHDENAILRRVLKEETGKRILEYGFENVDSWQSRPVEEMEKSQMNLKLVDSKEEAIEFMQQLYGEIEVDETRLNDMILFLNKERRMVGSFS